MRATVEECQSPGTVTSMPRGRRLDVAIWVHNLEAMSERYASWSTADHAYVLQQKKDGEVHMLGAAAVGAAGAAGAVPPPASLDTLLVFARACGEPASSETYLGRADPRERACQQLSASRRAAARLSALPRAPV